MGIATDLVKFFRVQNAGYTEARGIQPRSISDFLKAHPEHRGGGFQVDQLCRRLVAHGILLPAGRGSGGWPYDQAYCTAKFSEELASYGTYEFASFGFPCIREHFEESVRPVFVETEEGDQRNGSGFLIGPPRPEPDALCIRGFVTNAHCIKKMRSISIPGWDPSETPALTILSPVDERVDLAMILFGEDPFPDVPGFRFREAVLLEEVLTMGFPPIPGFQSVLVAERAHIAGHLKSSMGQIVAEEESYLDTQSYFLISARVKGGSSGGPVVAADGQVVGVVQSLPAEAGTTDTLGYGMAIPSSTFLRFVEACRDQSDSVESTPLTAIEGGIRPI